jgi:hypothetical protein
VELHDRDGSPEEEGERIGETVLPVPRKEVRHEAARERGGSDRGEQEEGNPSGDPPPKEEQREEVRRGGQRSGVT